MNSKFYKIGFLVLIAINITLIGLITLKPGPKHKPRELREIRNEISERLGFSEEQKTIFEKMAQKHRKNIRDIRSKEHQLINSYFEQLLVENSDKDKEVILEQILQLEKDKISITYAHFEKLKSLCNDTQLTEFDEVLKQVVPRLTNSDNRPIQSGRPPF